MSEIGVDIWRGGVQAWECDQMGHMNVAFYLAKATEALGGLAAELDLHGLFRPSSETTLVLRDQHVRYLREARLGAPLRMTGGVVEMGESDGRFLMLLHHANGALAATYQLVVAHVDARTGAPWPWPATALARAKDLAVEIPEIAAARSCNLGPVDPSIASLERARQMGMPQTTLCVIQPAECDAFGRFRPDAMLARLIDGAVHIGRRDENARKMFDPKNGVGGAAVEYRLIYFDWPKVGERMEVRAGWAAVEPRVRHLVYWAFDADSGRPLCIADSVTVSFDLNTRKMIVMEGEVLDAARAQVIPGLTF